jgi:GTPase
LITGNLIEGMTGHAPDFTMLMIGANAGVVGMTKEVKNLINLI